MQCAVYATALALIVSIPLKLDLAQVVSELAARAADQGPMVAAVPARLDPSRAANKQPGSNTTSWVSPAGRNDDPNQRTPVRLDLNNVFHGGATPATHLALQVAAPSRTRKGWGGCSGGLSSKSRRVSLMAPPRFSERLQRQALCSASR